MPPSHGGSAPHLIYTMVIGANWALIHTPSGTSIGSTVLQGSRSWRWKIDTVRTVLRLYIYIQLSACGASTHRTPDQHTVSPNVCHSPKHGVHVWIKAWSPMPSSNPLPVPSNSNAKNARLESTGKVLTLVVNIMSPKRLDLLTLYHRVSGRQLSSGLYIRRLASADCSI